MLLERTPAVMPTAPAGPLIIFILVMLIGSPALYLIFNELAAIGLLALGLLCITYCTYGQVPGFFGLIMIDDIWGTMYGISAGIYPISPLSKPQKENGSIKLIDLRVELNKTVVGTYDIIGGGRVIVTFDIYTRVRLNGNFSKDLVTFGGFEHGAIQQKAEGTLSGGFSDHFRKQSSLAQVLRLSKRDIVLATFGTAEGRRTIEIFEDVHGTELIFILKDVDFDATTKELRDKVAQAQTLADQYTILMALPGMTHEAAMETIRLMNFPNTSRQDWNLDVSGLNNLQNVHFAPLGMGGMKPPSGKPAGTAKKPAGDHHSSPPKHDH